MCEHDKVVQAAKKQMVSWFTGRELDIVDITIANTASLFNIQNQLQLHHPILLTYCTAKVKKRVARIIISHRRYCIYISKDVSND